MRDFNNNLFNNISKQVINKEQIVIDVNVSETEFTFLQYYLTRHFYYAVIVDDYPFEIVDKATLLEALYYQIRLITMHDLNWDAFEEALSDVLSNLVEFEGICLLFRNKNLKVKLAKELSILIDIIGEINKHSKLKRVNVLMNE